jgi:hypothetical protein
LHYLSGGVELSSDGCFRELALSFWGNGTLFWGVFQGTCIIFLEEWNSPLRGVSGNLHYLSGGIKWYWERVMIVFWDVMWYSLLKVSLHFGEMLPGSSDLKINPNKKLVWSRDPVETL